MKIDEIEMFKCFVCERYRPMIEGEHHSVKFKDFFNPKDVCDGCFQNMQKKEDEKKETPDGQTL